MGKCKKCGKEYKYLNKRRKTCTYCKHKEEDKKYTGKVYQRRRSRILV